MVKIYKQPFAHDGDAIAIPDASQPDGKMSSADGWTPDYQLPKTDPNYKPVGREEMNGVFKEVTEALGQVQVQGAASWSADGAPYPINAQVYHNGKQWIALRANSAEPADGADWSANGTAAAKDVATNAEALAGTGGVLPDAEQVRRNHVSQVATIVDLRNLEPAFDGQQAELLGHTVAGVGGGMFYADYSSSASDDNGITVVSAGGKRWVRDLAKADRVTVDMFGAVGDSITDDSAPLQNGFNWSANEGIPIYLGEKRYLTTSTLNAGRAIIRSLSGRPGGADPVLRRKPDGTHVTGAPNWNYFYNSSEEGLNYTWRQMIDDTSFGCAIISDFNGPILFVPDALRFDIDGIAVIGDHRKTSQDGLATALPAAYFGTSQKINNISVIGCGRHGINLERGFEVSAMEKVICNGNNGYGLRVGRVPGVDCATEYLRFDDCFFMQNRLGGVWFAQWRKAIALYNCNFNNSGQYDSPGGVDPLLGYSRTVPSTAAAMAAGVWVNDVSLDLGAGTGYSFVMEGCFGESMAKGLHLRGRQGSGVCRDVCLKNNQWFRAIQVGNSASNGGENGVGHYFDIGYVADWVLSGNYQHSLENYRFATVPNRDATNGIFFVDNGFPVSTRAEQEFAKFNYPAPVQSSQYIRAVGRTYGDQTLARSIGGLASDGNLNTSVIGADFTITTEDSTSNFVAMYSLTASWQSGNNNRFGVYLLFVSRVPSNQYMMTTIASSSTQGFTGEPTMNGNTGELTIPAEANYRYTIQRIDNVLTNATP